ncbi:MAG: inositol monophosphatase family protein [Candidatus Nanopelagicales bacterium]
MTHSDLEIARTIAQLAGAALLELRTGFGPVVDSNRRELMDAGDAAAQALIAAELARYVPADAVLSEEAPDTAARLGAARVWIIDPLDGTREYGQGRADFAVHVALWERAAGGLTTAAVDVPASGETHTTADAAGPAPLPTDRPLRLVVSRSRRPPGLDEFLASASAATVAGGINPLGWEEANVGSVGAKVSEVLCGRMEAYLHPGGLHEWDLAAPYACATARGYMDCHPTAEFNRMPPVNGPVLLAHPAVADILRAALG